MKKTITAMLLASFILSGTACNSKTYTSKESTKITGVTEATIAESDPLEDPSPSTPLPTPVPKIERLINTSSTKNHFDIKMKLNDTDNSVDIIQDLTYINDSGEALSDIYFNLIPNYFDRSGGKVEMNKVTVNDQECTLEQVEGTVYSLKLPSTLEKDGSTVIHMEYKVKVPELKNRFGYTNGIYNLGNMIVTPAQFENGKWLVEPYVDLGDAFYTRISDYNVSVEVPDGYQVASTGTLTDGVYVAKDVRDFALSIIKDCQVISDTVMNINVNVFYRQENAAAAAHAMEIAKKSLAFYSEKLGGYPYDTLNLVLSPQASGIGGMEYPGLVMISAGEAKDYAYDLYYERITLEELKEKIKEQEQASGDSEPVDTHETITDEDLRRNVLFEVTQLSKNVTHEVAHQWFYGIVGNDEIRYHWIDEGMCRFMEGYFLDDMGIDDTSYTPLERFKNIDESVYAEYNHQVENAFPVDMNLSLYDFISKNEEETYYEIYDKGAAMIYHIYNDLGPETFSRALKDYVQTFAFSEVTPDAFQLFWKEYGDFEEMFTVYLHHFE